MNFSQISELIIPSLFAITASIITAKLTYHNEAKQNNRKLQMDTYVQFIQGLYELKAFHFSDNYARVRNNIILIGSVPRINEIRVYENLVWDKKAEDIDLPEAEKHEREIFRLIRKDLGISSEGMTEDLYICKITSGKPE